MVPARGGRVAHNKRKGKGKDKCNPDAAPANGADAAAAAANAAVAPILPEINLIGAAAEKQGIRDSANDDGDADSKVYTTKMNWAAALQRAFFLDALASGCGCQRWKTAHYCGYSRQQRN